jgi:hypothetical protein
MCGYANVFSVSSFDSCEGWRFPLTFRFAEGRAAARVTVSTEMTTPRIANLELKA